MFKKLSIFLKLFALLGLLSIMLLITFYSNIINEFSRNNIFNLNEERKNNLDQLSTYSFHQELKKDINKQVKSAQDQAMNIKLSDLVKFLKRLEKVPQDMENFKKEIKKNLKI